ncbi:MAG TPA: protein-glutamate O-methyltransferase CheR [Pirellulales bacterium]|jgi:chemotaxis protein methyltransferase CheR|nr:protein-glutamate O-methyltransferase CheR [Pirellulales bacterium]
MELDQRNFELIRDLIYQETGMTFEDRKLMFVQVRVARRIAALGCESPRDYYRCLRYEDADRSELQNLVNLLTTNETYFFREYPQLECFANHVLPAVAEKRRQAGDYRLSVWSAACSTGDEAYTLAIILRACLDDFPRWRIQLLATDIDTGVLSAAQEGVYSERAVKDVPDQYLERYFEARGGKYRVSDEITRMVTFSRLNLIDRRAMRCHRDYDVIFCRNALIYFDDSGRRKVLSSFYDALQPGGYLFLGHSESAGRISAAYQMVSLGGHITYCRPAEPARTAPLASGDELCLTESKH